MNNLIPTRVNPDYYYNKKKDSELDIFNEDDKDDKYNNEFKEPLKYTIKQKFISISSLDRDWYNNITGVNPFNYNVKIGDNGSFTLLNNIKNIVSLEIVKMILPNKNINIEYSKETFNLTDEPYFTVELSGFDNVNDGTNHQKNKATSIMSSITPIPKSTNEINYLEYKNINNSIKKFTNPISNLTNLEIKIKNQLDEYPLDLTDILNITNIYSSNDEDETLNLHNVINIKTTEYFNNQYKIGDVIKCQDYVFRDTSNEVVTTANDFNDFINRTKGHKIIDLKNSNYSYFTITQSGTTITQYKDANTHYNDRSFASGDTDSIIVYEDNTVAFATFSNTTTITSSYSKTITTPERIYLKSASQLLNYYNIIVISIPYTISTSAISLESWWSTLKSTSIIEEDASQTGDSGGKLINTHLQSHLFINVNYLEYENAITTQLA